MERKYRLNRPSFSVYDASAGSGKTYTLVKEYLKIVLLSRKIDAYRNILAITFTNKAVHEMKSRIVENLYEFSKDDTSEKSMRLLLDLEKETGVSIAELKSKAKKVIKYLVHNYASFDILTIDKFTYKVIRAFAHDLGLPVTFEVTLDTDSLLSEAVDAIISQAGESKSMTDLLVAFTLEKADEDKSWDITREIFEISKLLYSENNREQIGDLKEKSIEDFIEIKKNISKLKNDLEAENKTLGEAAMALLTSKNIDLKSFSRGTFPNHLKSICEGNYRTANKKFRKDTDIDINKSASDRALIYAIIPDLLTLLQKVYLNFERIAFYNAFLKNATPLSLLNTISNEVSKIQKEQNVLSIAEFNSLIYHQIQNQPAAFIYERMGEKYHHFFIDEFQDTSEMQWNNLIPLIDNALSGESSAGEKGTLMIVGDPKQSIYRWRGGKAEQFIELSKNKNPFHNPDKKQFHLDTNFRSYSNIIDFNNEFFHYLSEEFEDPNYRDLYENHSRQFTNSKKGGYVDITFLSKKIEEDPLFDEEEETDRNAIYCRVTLDKIHEILSQGFEYKDIAILTRKKVQGALIAHFLSDQNIPLISSESLLIENSIDVCFVVNVLEYLNNRSNLEAKADFLYYLASKYQESIAVHDFIQFGMKLEQESEFESWLSKFDISIIFRDLRKKSLYEAVELIIGTFLHNEICDAYLQRFLDLVLERDFHKQAGISDFLVFWRENSADFSIPSPEGINAVRILTVHKSKGLEFPVVIMPFADEDYEKKPREKIWIEDVDHSFGLPKVLVDNSKVVENFGAEALNVYTKHRQEELLDNINVLYVALTRAEEQLYIISTFVHPKKDGDYPYNMASYFLKYLRKKELLEENKLHYHFGLKERLSIGNLIPRNEQIIPPVLAKFNPKSIKIAQRESLLWGTNQKSAIEYGNVIHQILSEILHREDIERVVAIAMEMGLIQQDQKEIVSKTIHQIVSHPDLEMFFARSNRVLNEQVIIQMEGGMAIPDRIAINSRNELYLLDYKTGKHQDKYRIQLEKYQQVLEKMNYQVKAKMLVYIGEKIELVHL